MPEILEYQRAGLEARADRIDSLDLLRGVAILGIFLMNTQSMGLVGAAYLNPSTGGGNSFVDGVAYCVVHLVADMKFITLFSIMFGAGILLQSERAANRGRSGAALHYRRMAVLLVIGLVHAYGIWYGDILVSYVLCGLLLYPLGRWLPAWITLCIGVLMILAASAIAYALHIDLFAPLTALRDWAWSLYEGLDETALYTHDVAGEFHMRAIASLDEQTRVFLTWTFWRCGGAILLGMALQKWRFFQGQWPAGAYALLALLLAPTGWALSAIGIWFNDSQNWDPFILEWPGMEFNYFGSLLTAVGYLATGVLVARWVALAASGAGPLHARLAAAAVSPIRAVGRMALSNYLFQSVVGTAIFYGHGLGKFNQIDRIGLLGIVALVWGVQLTASWFYMRAFRQGPVEWLWHQLVYLGHRSAAIPSIEPLANVPPAR
jgi:uncharacterized protein